MRKRLRSREEASEDEKMENPKQVRSNNSDEGEKILKRKRAIDYSSSPPPPTEPPQRTRRSMRRSKTICSCTSPTSTFLNAHSTFSWFVFFLSLRHFPFLFSARFHSRNFVVVNDIRIWWFRRLIFATDEVWNVNEISVNFSWASL